MLSLVLYCHLWLGSPDIDGRRNSADQDSVRSCAYCCRPTSRVWDRLTSMQNLVKASRSHYTHMPITTSLVLYWTQSLIKSVHQRELVQWGRQQERFGGGLNMLPKSSFNCVSFITPLVFVCFIFCIPTKDSHNCVLLRLERLFSRYILWKQLKMLWYQIYYLRILML